MSEQRRRVWEFVREDGPRWAEVRCNEFGYSVEDGATVGGEREFLGLIPARDEQHAQAMAAQWTGKEQE